MGIEGERQWDQMAHTIIGAVKWTNVPCVRMYCGIKTSELGRGFAHFNLFFFSLFSFCCGWLNDDNKNAASFDIPRLFFSDKKKQKKNGNITPTTHAVNKRDRERIWRANMCIRECFVWSRWLIYTHRNDEYSASECLPPHSMGWKKLSHMPSWCEHTKQKKNNQIHQHFGSWQWTSERCNVGKKKYTQQQPLKCCIFLQAKYNSYALCIQSNESFLSLGI